MDSKKYMAALHELCNINDIPFDGSTGFTITIGSIDIRIIAISHQGRFYTYINSCPHIANPLDLKPGIFLDVLKENIICSRHGALFRIRDGRCTYGPCLGKKLISVNNRNRRGKIFITIPTSTSHF